MSKQFKSFYWKRWHSLAGMIPVGFFLLLHWYSNSFAASGKAAYEANFTRSMSPWFLVLEVFFLYIPLLVHLYLGVIFVFKSDMKTMKKARNIDNWRFVLQRISGLGIAAFVIVHFGMTRGHSWFAKDGWVNGAPVEGWFTHMQNAMHHNLTFFVYIMGILGAAYHLGNGFWTFFNTMGWSVGAGAQAKLKKASMFLILVLIIMGLYPIFVLRGIL